MRRIKSFITIISLFVFTEALFARPVLKSEGYQQNEEKACQIQADPDYKIWKNKWDAAHVKLKKSNIFMLSAAGVGATACIIGMVAAKENASKNPMGEQGSSLVYACVAVGGASILFELFGALKVIQARREVKALENEGKSKGYFSLLLNPGKNSIGISFVLNF